MTIRRFALVFLLVFQFAASASFADANRLKSFLKACAWGTVIGAGVGAVSLAFENKPSDHTGNIARGASLGLYGGIAYGLIDHAEPLPPPRAGELGARDEAGATIALVPEISGGQLRGARLDTFVWAF